MDNTEIELRYHINDYIKLIEYYDGNFNNNKIIRYIISLVQPIDEKSSKIKEVEFINGNKSTKYIKKTKNKVIKKFDKTNNIVSLKTINTSTEAPISEFKLIGNILTRCKLRETIKYESYQMDFTLIFESIKFMTDEIIKNKLSISNAIHLLRTNKIDYKLEFEVELLDNMANINDIENDVYNKFTEFDRFNKSENFNKFENNNKSENFNRSENFNKFNTFDIYNIKSYENIKSPLKRLLPQVITLTKKNYIDLYETDLFMTIKADGERCLCIIDNNKIKIINTKSEIILDKNVGSKMSVILDGEYVRYKNDNDNMDDINDINNVLFYIFDIIYHSEFDLSNKTFEHRLKCFESININTENLSIVSKSFIHLNYENKDLLKSSILDLYNAKYQFDTDGLILIENIGDYKNTKSYKFKELKNTTNDYYIKIVKDKIYLLCGINIEMFNNLGLSKIPELADIEQNNQYGPIQFCPSDDINNYTRINYDKINEYIKINKIEFNNLNGLIGEFVFIDGLWNIIKIREDKSNMANYYGNDYKVAELNWLNYFDPLNLEHLWNGVSKGYFKNDFNSNTRPNYIMYTSIIKSYIIEKLDENSIILDIGSGKGQDIIRYMNNKTKKLVCVDNDKLALVDLVYKHYDVIKNNKFSKTGGEMNMINTIGEMNMINTSGEMNMINTSGEMNMVNISGEINNIVNGGYMNKMNIINDGVNINNISNNINIEKNFIIQNAIDFINKQILIDKQILMDKQNHINISDKQNSINTLGGSNYSTQINIVYADCTNNYLEIYKKIENVYDGKFDNIICNLAIHYLLGNNEDNLINLVSNIIKPGGKFNFICYSGERISELFDNKNSITFDKINITIKKLYDDNTKHKKIGVMLPFGDGEFTEEYLLTESFLKKLSVNFKLFSARSIIEYMNFVQLELSDVEIDYLSLFYSYSFVKI